LRDRVHLAPDVLYKLYVDDKLSPYEIAQKVGLSYMQVRYSLGKLKIPIRNRKEAGAICGSKKRRWTPELLRKLYWQEELSTLEIGKRLNLSKASIKDAMERYGIPRRTRQEATSNAHKTGRLPNYRANLDATQLYNLYWGQSFSIPKIAKELKISTDVVRNAMLYSGIPRRSRSEAGRLWQSKGDKNASWKGGRTRHQGYNLIRQLEHPRANNQGYVREHILVWEEVHNRFLPQGWVVHHLNGIKDDNRPENLVAFSSRKHAHVLAAKGKRIRELEAKVKLFERALEQSQLIFNIGEN